MVKVLTFDSIKYSIWGNAYVLQFEDRKLSFTRLSGTGPRILIQRLAKGIGMTAGEMKAYIRGLREMRQLVKRQIRNMENVKRFCRPQHRQQLSGPVPDAEMRGYLDALKDIERICGK